MLVAGHALCVLRTETMNVCVCVCVCVRERERDRGVIMKMGSVGGEEVMSLHGNVIQIYIF